MSAFNAIALLAVKVRFLLLANKIGLETVMVPSEPPAVPVLTVVTMTLLLARLPVIEATVNTEVVAAEVGCHVTVPLPEEVILLLATALIVILAGSSNQVPNDPLGAEVLMLAFATSK